MKGSLKKLVTKVDRLDIKHKTNKLFKHNILKVLGFNVFVILNTLFLMRGSLSIISIFTVNASLIWLSLMKSDKSVIDLTSLTLDNMFDCFFKGKRTLDFMLMKVAIYASFLVILLPMSLVIKNQGLTIQNVINWPLHVILLSIGSFIVLIIGMILLSQVNYIFFEEDQPSILNTIKRSVKMMSKQFFNYISFMLSYLVSSLAVILLTLMVGFLFYNTAAFELNVLITSIFGMSLFSIYLEAGKAGYYYIVTEKIKKEKKEIN